MKKLLPVALLAIAACTQEPVNVVLKGSQFFGRDQQLASNTSTSTFAWSNNPSPSRIEFHEEAPTEPQRVGSVGVSELPPLLPSSQSSLQGNHQPSAKLAVIEKDLSEIKLVPTATTPQTEGLRFASAVRVESPGGASEVADDWYKGQIVLAKANVPDAPNFIWPVRGKIISHYGPKANGLHNDGINIAAHLGDPIYAAANGVVVYAGNDLKGYGNMVIVRHENGWMSAYAHADQLLVMENERVSQGQRIATVGSTGSVDTAQLHFGLRNGKAPVDPARFLNSDYAAAR